MITQKLALLAFFPVMLLTGTGPIRAEVPTQIAIDSAKINALESPFLLVTPAEIEELKTRIAQDPAAKKRYATLIAKVEGYLAKPLKFPEQEAGWLARYNCPKCTAYLDYNPESPHRHYCGTCKEEREGLELDQAWNERAMLDIADRMEAMGVAALVSKEPRYAAGLKEAWQDIASKYPKFRLHEKGMNFTENPPSTSGRATCQSIDESNLVSKLAYSWDALLATKTLSSQEQDFIQRNFWQVANTYFHRVLDLHGSGGNWWVWHNTGALSVGVFTKDTQLMDKAYNMKGSGILDLLASGYIRADGMVDERSPGYQAYAMEALSRMTHLSQRVGLPLAGHPRVQAGFTGYIELLQPDLGLPCMNDSGRISFAHGNHWTLYLDILELGWSIYRSPEILNTLQVLNSSPVVSKAREDRLYSLLYGPADLKATPFSMPPVYAPNSGVALLRSPQKDWTLLLKNNPDPKGHAHANALQFGMFANGEEFAPAFGTCAYSLPLYLDWYVRTLASNTLAFNMQSQALRGIDNKTEWGIATGPVQAVYATSRNAQGPKDPGPAAQLSRLVLLSPLAMYEILRVDLDPLSKKKNVEQSLNQLDSVLHYSGTLAWQLPSKPAPVPWQLPSVESLRAEFEKTAQGHHRFHDPMAPYRLLENPRALKASQNAFLRGELKQPLGGKVALALFPLQQDESAWQFDAPGFEFAPDKKLPLVMRRVAANRARFGSISVPFRGENPLRSAKLLVDTPVSTLLQVTLASGSETVFQSTKPGLLKAGRLEMSGSLGVISELKGARIYTLNGDSLADSAGKVSVNIPGSVQVKIEGKKTLFTNLGVEPVTVTWTPAEGKPVSQTLPAQPKN